MTSAIPPGDIDFYSAFTFTNPVDFEFAPLSGGNYSKDRLLEIGPATVPLMLVRNEGAKRYVLRVRSDGTVRLTIPRRGSERSAREFAARHADWVKRQLERAAARRIEESSAWRVGGELLFRGEKVPIELGPVEVDSSCVRVADQTILVRPEVAMADLRVPIQQHLRALAATELPARVWFFASMHQSPVKRVTVRSQRSRWGSCSRRGTISLNWRLIQTPPFVSDYIILHELMHLRQMNHSSKFWSEVEQVCPEFREADRWLRKNSSLLRSY